MDDPDPRPVVQGRTPHEVAARIHWLERRHRYGPSGCSPAGHARLLEAVRRKARWCRKGKHRMTGTNVESDGRCKACRLVRLGRKREAALSKRRLARLRINLMAAHPDHGGSRAKLEKALAKWRQASGGHPTG